MTVAELRALLELLPGDARVWAYDGESEGLNVEHAPAPGQFRNGWISTDLQRSAHDLSEFSTLQVQEGPEGS